MSRHVTTAWTRRDSSIRDLALTALTSQAPPLKPFGLQIGLHGSEGVIGVVYTRGVRKA